MPKKTVQCLKITASITLSETSLQNVDAELLGEDGKAQSIRGLITRSRIHYSHAVVARYDDPAYQARVTEHIAKLKEQLATLGTIDTWNVTAGAVPVDEAEVLPDEPAKAPADDKKLT